MRMWMVDPKLMCRQHLIGEHQETHAIVGLLNRACNNFSVRGYFHSSKGEFRPLIEVVSLDQRHYDLSEEMVLRGYQHRSPFQPLAIETVVWLEEQSYLEIRVDVERSTQILFERCGNCRIRKVGN